jgi:putative hemolysin
LEPEPTIYVVLLVLIFIYISMVTISKVVFTHIASYQAALKEQRVKFVASKIEVVMANRPLFASTISLSKTLAGTSFALVLNSFTLSLNVFSTTTETAIFSILTTSIVVAVLGYALPKAIATVKADSFVFIAHIFYWFNKILLFPIAWTMSSLHYLTLKLFNYDERLSFLTEDEKDRLSKDADKEEVLDREEREMIRNIFDFGDTTIKEIMVPRVDVESLPITTDYATAIATISNVGHSRIPVYGETIDSIEGILYAKDILKWLSTRTNKNDDEWDMGKILRKAFFVPTSKKLDDLMTEMKSSRNHIVIVVDEYGGTAGIATMEDMLEEIVGDIHDEYDVEPEPVKKVGERTYLVDPHIELDDLAELLPLPSDYEDKEYNTLGGLFYHELGEVPIEGQEFIFDTLKLKINKMDNQRIEEILLVLPESANVTEIDDSF